MAWIESHQELWRHPKTKKLARELNIPIPYAIGLLHGLWYYALDFAQDGNLSKIENEELADAAGWNQDANEFVTALIKARFIDKEDDGSVLHDWNDYAGRLMDQRAQKRENDRKRQQNYRQKHRDKERHVDVTRDTEVNRTCTVPNTTVPNHTILFDDVVDKGRSQSMEAVENFLESRSLTLDAYIDMTDSIKAEAQQITESIFQKFTKRVPTQQDVVNVFAHTCKRSQVDGEWDISFNRDTIDLLLYSFEKSTMAGCPGNWNYINGCMDRLTQRGIKTLEDAEQFDYKREGSP